MKARHVLSLATVLVLTAGVVAAFAVNQDKSLSVALGGQEKVDHHITFTKANVSEFLNEDGFALAELSATTDNGNTFKSSDITIQDYGSEGPKQGGEDDDFIFLIHNAGHPYYCDNYVNFYLSFAMNVDVANSVRVTVTRTTHFNDGESTSNSTQVEEANKETTDNLSYSINYSFEFTNKYFEYVTIDAVDVYYSCTY
ncbi:MAG: hypothetical protein K6B65_00060 [Bacilli bacterium]|nr:hypothetical protein [Bacilli bacterium]